MVPKIHAKGSSFKGAAAYLLHDKDRADSAERVEWVETRNLAADDPEIAWRIMAATALDQARLKAEDGVKNTGRKSDKHVLHISLAWHPDQEPSREDICEAADAALAAIGAEDRQSMIIAHNDEEHPHVHLLVNRVSPIDGRHLSQSNDRLKLSKWAEEYERKGGHIYCEDRVINNAAREQGAYVKGAKDEARHIYEARPAANDNDRAAAEIAAQKAKDHALSLKGRNLAKMQAREWEKLEAAHEARKAALARQLTRDTAKARAAVHEEFRPAWRKLNRDQASERETFAALEESFFGRASNMARALRASSNDVGEGRTGLISRAFRILTNAGERKAYFEAGQERARQALQRAQDTKTADASKELKAEHTADLDAHRAVYLKARDDLAATHEAARAKLQAEWKDRTAERKASFGAVDQAIMAQRSKALARSRPDADDPRAAMLERYARSVEFKKAAERPSNDQDKRPGRDLDQADD